MNKRERSIRAIVTLGVGLRLVGCGDSEYIPPTPFPATFTPEPTRAPTATLTPWPTETPAPTPTETPSIRNEILLPLNMVGVWSNPDTNDTVEITNLDEGYVKMSSSIPNGGVLDFHTQGSYLALPSWSYNRSDDDSIVVHYPWPWNFERIDPENE